ncbi:MAG: hypothetical protein GY696_24715 [Gammaproteobacteria bacterium]|nr:hypothetical protein [Gammaproteobacteria bacterium]
MLSDWNDTMALLRNELEKTMAAETSKFGWGVFSDAAKRPRFSDPELQKVFEEGTKGMKEREMEERKHKTPASGSGSWPFPVRGTGRTRPHSSGYRGSYRGRGSATSNYPDGHRTKRSDICYNCQQTGHHRDECPNAYKPRFW